MGGINSGEEKLFEKKLSKEEKKAQADAKKAAKKGDGEGDGDTIDISEAGDEYAANGDEASSSSSDAKTKKAASKGSKKKDKGAQEDEAVGGDSLLQIDEGTLKFAVCTGNLASRKDSKDVKIQAFSISLFGKVLFEDQTLELTWGHRYGLVGQNGSGKTTFLKCIASRQIPIPEFIDIWYLDKEAEPSAIDFVIDTVRLEKERLEKLEEEIMSESGPE